MVVSEREGSAVLAERFTAAGYRIESEYPYELLGSTIRLDGYDPAARVGFEYLTTEAGDREELSPAVIAELEARMGRGELFLLLVDEREVADVELLRFAADHFLSSLATRRGER
jgi:hypothetical protein